MKNLLTAALFVLFSGVLFAQTASVQNVLNIKNAQQTGKIIENNKLVGYYIFYFKEKNDSKTTTYEIELFDDNFNRVHSFELTRPKGTSLMEMVYNGDAFMLFFFNKEGYEFVTYDRKGKQLGEKSIIKKEIPRYDVDRSEQALTSSTENVTIYPLSNKGFVRQTYTKGKKMGYEVVAYDNKMSEIWSYASPESSDKIETIEIAEVTSKYVTGTVSRKSNMMTRKMSNAFIILDSQTGKLLTELNMGNEDDGKESVLKSFYDESIDRLVLVGEYYKPGDDILKDKSIGLFVQELDASGKISNRKEYKWKGDIDKFKNENLSEEELKEARDGFYIFFHDVVRAENGDLYLIGEQFRKQVSALGTAGTALAALGGGSSETSNFEIRVMNMVVMKFNKENNLIDFEVVSKKKTSVLLPAGAGFWGTTYLGYYIKSIGGFDYSYTSNDVENDEFTVVYTDYNRKTEKGGDKADKMLGVIHITSAEMQTKRVAINTDANSWWMQPAKPGYISVFEYFRKEKKLEMRLEPLTL